ncbi:endonuclease III [bacterium]|jgi:endonuclease III|nr:endonuclease III [bacterium]
MPCTMMSSIIDTYGKNPFLILISCILSLRSRDAKTLSVCVDLFAKAITPEELLALPPSQLESILYPIGFYKQKTQTLRHVSAELIKRFNGKVPQTEEDLLSIKGVGRKTSALVLSSAFDIPAICVDVHVHRIANLLGIVHTMTPHQTEMELMRLLPKKYWHECNSLFVMFGQNVKPKDIVSIFNQNK